MREIDGLKVAFVEGDSYFAGFHTPSMYTTAKKNGADVVFLIAEGKTEAGISDDEIRALVEDVAVRRSGRKQ